MNEKREQVLAQCRAVIHMAHTLATVHDQLMPAYADGNSDSILDIVGRRTARFMEELGDMLNSMDANDDADEWIVPVMRKARKMWASPETKSCNGRCVGSQTHGEWLPDVNCPLHGLAATLNRSGVHDV